MSKFEKRENSPKTALKKERNNKTKGNTNSQPLRKKERSKRRNKEKYIYKVRKMRKFPEKYIKEEINNTRKENTHSQQLRRKRGKKKKSWKVEKQIGKKENLKKKCIEKETKQENCKRKLTVYHLEKKT